MTIPVAVLRHLNAAQAAEALAGTLAKQLSTAVKAWGEASVVLSGGRTPLPMWQALRAEPLPWARITVTLADERFVPVDDAHSNERLLREVLLQGPAAQAQFIGLRGTAGTPQQAASEAWERLAAIARPFDAVVLGMGDDGHTASLFPGSPGLTEALDARAEPACVVMQAPVAPMARLSLNLAALRQARQMYLHFTGEAKWQVWTGAEGLPVSRTLSRMYPLAQLYWAP